jgi:hypothetical protein
MSAPPAPQPQRWEFANLGFNTMSKLWFFEIHNFMGLIETFQAKAVLLKGGAGIQYQWPEKGGKQMWHVRERIFSQDVNKVEYDQNGTLVVEFKPRPKVDEEIPEDFESITYAYSLQTSRGFVEFRDKNDVVIKKISEKWIAVENLPRMTTGEYPNIRLMAKRADIVNVVVTNTCIVIVGNA